MVSSSEPSNEHFQLPIPKNYTSVLGLQHIYTNFCYVWYTSGKPFLLGIIHAYNLNIFNSKPFFCNALSRIHCIIQLFTTLRYNCVYSNTHSRYYSLLWSKSCVFCSCPFCFFSPMIGSPRGEPTATVQTWFLPL